MNNTTATANTTSTQTKMDLAKAIVNANPDMARKQLIPLLMEKAGLTINSASLYHHKITKANRGGAPAVRGKKKVSAMMKPVLPSTETMTKEALLNEFNAARVKSGMNPLAGWKKSIALLREGVDMVRATRH